MPIDDALEQIRVADELKELKESKWEAEAALKLEQARVAELNSRLEEYKKRLDSQVQEGQQAIMQAHLRGLANFWPPKDPKDQMDEAIIKLVTHSNFPEIYRNTLILKEPLRRLEYFLMRGLQLETVNLSMDQTELFVRLAPLGLNVICPYFQYAGKVDNVYDQCLIYGDKEIDTLCSGRYDICKIFKDQTKEFITGEAPYVAPPKTYLTPALELDGIEREQQERQLLSEIEKFWRDDE